MAVKSDDPVQPWEMRLCAAIPVPPLAMGAICFAAAVAASLLYYEFVIGSPMWQPEASGFGGLSEGRRNAILAARMVAVTSAEANNMVLFFTVNPPRIFVVWKTGVAGGGVAIRSPRWSGRPGGWTRAARR